MSYTEQLERESEQTRSQLANTLDELRACMTPGHVLDQLADRMSNGAGTAFARNLKDQAVNNPLPVALIGAGLAWLMLGNGAGRTGSSLRGAAGRLRDATGNAADSARHAADTAGRTVSDKSAEWGEKASGLGGEAAASLGSAAERARQAAAETGDSLRETAGAMADSAQRTASAGYETITDGARRTASALSETTKAAGQRTLQTGNSLLDFCREQPMVLAGLGIAVGAMMGALLPTTETEDRLMGDTSDRLKERAKDVASEQYENARKVGERALDAATDEAVKRAGTDEADPSSKERAANQVQADEATLSPAQPGDGDWRGQPRTAENAPL